MKRYVVEVFIEADSLTDAAEAARQMVSNRMYSWVVGEEVVGVPTPPVVSEILKTLDEKSPTELEKWVELFGILNKYEFSDFSVSATDEFIWLHFPTDRLNVSDRKRIIELGWIRVFGGSAITRTV